MKHVMVGLLFTWGHIIGRIVCPGCGNREVVQVRLAKDGHKSVLVVDVDAQFRNLSRGRPGRRADIWAAYDLTEISHDPVRARCPKHGWLDVAADRIREAATGTATRPRTLPAV